MRKIHVLSVLASAVLVACGGGGDDGGNRGVLLEPPQTIATLSAAQIDAAATASGLRALSGPAKCDVKIVQLHYGTIGAQGEATDESAAMLIPTGLDPLGQCSRAFQPLIAYAKGTDAQKPRTLANPNDSETFLLAAMYATQGYVVVATDYLGYARSAYPYHPYLHADSEASSVIDSIRAARNAAAPLTVGLNGKVMLTGYSQGGHSSMAAQRAIERDLAAEIPVTAAAHLAGPYNLSGSFRLTNAIAGYQFFVPFLVTAWQKVYGNVYTSVTQAFKLPYSNYIETLLPSPTLNFTTLVTTGALPGGPTVTPDQARDIVFQPAFLADVQTNPANGLMQDAQKNDLLGWTPKARTLLCGGAGDPTVPPAVHMNVAQADFASRGLTNVTSVDVDPAIQATFGVAGKAPTDPTSAAFASYFANYHGTFEPPLCAAQARALFDSLR